MSEKKDKLANAAGAAGGTILTAGYYKAARDNEMGKDWNKARKKFNSELQRNKIPIQSKRGKQLREEWEIKQAKNHGVIRSQYENTAKRSKKVPAVRGRYALDKKGNPIRKAGKLVRKNDKIGTLIRMLPGSDRATLPRVFLKLPKFR